MSRSIYCTWADYFRTILFSIAGRSSKFLRARILSCCCLPFFLANLRKYQWQLLSCRTVLNRPHCVVTLLFCSDECVPTLFNSSKILAPVNVLRFQNALIELLDMKTIALGENFLREFQSLFRNKNPQWLRRARSGRTRLSFVTFLPHSKFFLWISKFVLSVCFQGN